MLYSPTNHQSKAETKILVLLISFKIKRYIWCFTMPQFQLKCALNYSKITFISFDLNKKIKPLGSMGVMMSFFLHRKKYSSATKINEI